MIIVLYYRIKVCRRQRRHPGILSSQHAGVKQRVIDESRGLSLSMIIHQ